MKEQVQYIEYNLEYEFKNATELAKEFDCSPEIIVNARHHIGAKLADFTKANNQLLGLDKNVIWTEEEDKIIVSYLEKHGKADVKILKTFIDKTSEQIKRRAIQLKAANRVRDIEEVIWNDKNLKYLIEHYPTKMNYKISEELKISEHRIDTKAKELGLKKADLAEVKRDEILKYWRAGKSAKEVAILTDLNYQRVNNFAREHQIRFKGVVPGNEDKNTAIEIETRLGKSIDEIASKYNVSEVTVKRLSYERWDEEEWRKEHMPEI